MGDYHWENKTAVFQSRLDIQELAMVGQILTEHFGQRVTTVSRLVSMALHTLVQIGVVNGWCSEPESLRDAYLYLMERGIYAINKNDQAGVEQILKESGKKIKIPVMDYIVEQEMERSRERVKTEGDLDRALGGKSKQELIDEFMKSEDVIKSTTEGGDNGKDGSEVDHN